jgi:hypothetical protein
MDYYSAEMFNIIRRNVAHKIQVLVAKVKVMQIKIWDGVNCPFSEHELWDSITNFLPS